MHSLFSAPLLALLMLLSGGGWLGVYLVGDADRAVVAEVLPGSPAQRAGVAAGDVIVAVDQAEVSSRNDLIRLIGSASPGEEVTLGIERDGKKIELKVELGERPSEIAVPETARPAPVVRLRTRPGRPDGEAGAEPTPFLGLGLSETDEGVLIDRVVEGGPAAKTGLRVGDRIRAIGKLPVHSIDDVEEALEVMRVGQPIEIRASQGKKSRVVEIVPVPRRRFDRIEEEPGTEVREFLESEEVERGANEAVGRRIERLRRQIAELRKELDALRRQLHRPRK